MLQAQIAAGKKNWYFYRYWKKYLASEVSSTCHAALNN